MFFVVQQMGGTHVRWAKTRCWIIIACGINFVKMNIKYR